MNIDALRYFVAVAEASSIREAAENLHIAQSALSRQIQNLESELSTRLFSRLPRGVALTDEGRVVLRRARESLAALATARDEISALHGLTIGDVRIASIDSFADALLPDLISRFHGRHPNIRFDVRIGNTRQVLEFIREGIVEIGIVYNAPVEPPLRVLASLEQPLAALVSTEHPLAGRRQIGMRDLAGYPLAVAPARSPTRRLIDEAAQRARLDLQILVESDSVPVRLGLAERGLVIAVLAQMSARRAVGEGRLRAIPIRDSLLQASRLQTVALEGRVRSRAMADFERLLYRSIRGLHTAKPVDLKMQHAKIGQLALENDFLSGAFSKAGLLSAKK